MPQSSDVLCAGIIVADYVCTPFPHLPGAGEVVLADHILLTIGGCAANVAVDLVKMDVPAGVVGRVGERRLWPRRRRHAPRSRRRCLRRCARRPAWTPARR